MVQAAIGFRCHIGWATAITVGRGLEAIDRRRIELWDPGTMTTSAPYHLAGGEEHPTFRDAVQKVRDYIGQALEALLDDLEADVVGLGVVLTTPFPADKLRHPQARKHQGDADIYRYGVLDAAHERGLRAVRVVEASIRNATPPRVLFERFGRPWRVEERLATIAALRALES